MNKLHNGTAHQADSSLSFKRASGMSHPKLFKGRAKREQYASASVMATKPTKSPTKSPVIDSDRAAQDKDYDVVSRATSNMLLLARSQMASRAESTKNMKNLRNFRKSVGANKTHHNMKQSDEPSRGSMGLSVNALPTYFAKSSLAHKRNTRGMSQGNIHSDARNSIEDNDYQMPLSSKGELGVYHVEH